MLQERVEVRQLNATDFRLDRKPYGIVYSNELLDALAIEPIVDIDGTLHKVKVVPYTTTDRPSDQIWTPGNGLEGFDGRALTKDGAMVLLRGDKTKVGYCPVFIPLSYDPELEERVRSTRSLGRAINSPDFGGLYPLQLKAGALLDSARASFDHGLVLFVDYASHREGQHNWNVTANHFRDYVFGEEDVDFQVDFNQVVEEGQRRGFRPIYFETQKDLLKQSFGLVQLFTDRDYKRWGQVNSDVPKRGNVVAACLGAYTMCFTLIPHDAYKVLVMQF